MPAMYSFKKGNTPIVATAIHDGHLARNSLNDLFNLTEQERLREEDPFTARWTSFTDNSIVFHHSRFETDVNRPRDKCVYRKPEDAWGLEVWKNEPDEKTVLESLSVYDGFYVAVKNYFDELFREHDRIIVYDIHSYNHRRESDSIAADPQQNPEINIGTQNMDAGTWHPLVEVLIENLGSYDFGGRQLDVRENIKFKGGYFGNWLYKTYENKICPISIEFKKYFMDEWTGTPVERDIEMISAMLSASVKPVLEALKKLNHS